MFIVRKPVEILTGNFLDTNRHKYLTLGTDKLRKQNYIYLTMPNFKQQRRGLSDTVLLEPRLPTQRP